MHESQRLNIEAARICTFATFSNRQLERFKDTFILLRNAKYLKFVKTDGKYKTEHKCIVRLRGKQRYLEEASNLDDQLGNIKVFNLICQKPILRLSSDPEYKIALCFQTDQCHIEFSKTDLSTWLTSWFCAMPYSAQRKCKF